MLEQLRNVVESMLGTGQDARGANAGATPARMEASGSGSAAPSGDVQEGGSWERAVSSASTASAMTPQLRLSGNPADRLPAEPRRRYLKVLDEAESAEAIGAAIFERLEETRRALMTAQARESNLRSRDGGRLDEDSVAVMDARAKATAARAELERLRARQDEHREKARPARELAAAIQGFVERVLLHVPEIEAAPTIAVVPPKAGETWGGLVEAKRQKLAKLHEDRLSILDAPRPSAVAKAMAREEIERIAARGAPGVMALLEGGDRIEWPRRMIAPAVVFAPDGSYGGTTDHRVNENDAIALICWTLRDELIARLDTEIDEHADDKSALDEPTRAKKLAHVSAAILSIQREECALIEKAREAGVVIAHRADVDARALLGLADNMPPPDRGLL